MSRQRMMMTALVAAALCVLATGTAAQTIGGAGGGGSLGGQGAGRGGGTYKGPAGTGQPGGFSPAGGATQDGPSNPAGSGTGGTGTGGTGTPGDGGTTGGGGDGGGSPNPGNGLNPPTPGFGGNAGGSRPRGGRTTGPLGIGVGDDSWQNWWRLNEDHFLDVERRYRERTANEEQSLDEFVGESGVPSTPADGGSSSVRKKILPLLERGLRHGHFSVRAEAAIALGKIGSAGDVSKLVPLTKDDNKAVRKAAIIGLGLLRSPRALPYLRQIMRDTSTKNAERGYAALALGVVGDRKAGPWLIALLDKGRRVRDVDAAALYALGLIGDPRSRTYLEYFISGSSNDDFLRAVAVQGLAVTQSPSVVNQLLQSLGDRDVRVRRSAAAGLGAISFESKLRAQLDDLEHQQLVGDGFARAEEELENYIGRLRVNVEAEERTLAMQRKLVVETIAERAFEDSDTLVQNFGSISLGEIGGEDAVNHLLAALASSKLDSRRSFTVLGLAIAGAEDTGTELRRHLARGRMDADTRAAIILALGLLDERRAASSILRQLKSRGDTSVASFAGLSLGLLEEKKAAPFMKGVVLGKSRPELKRPFGLGLALMGETEFIEALAEQLRKRGPVVTKVEVSAALAGIKDEKSLSALVAAAERKSVKDRVLAAIIRAAGIIGERGTLPILSPMFRHMDYTVRATILNEVALL